MITTLTAHARGQDSAASKTFCGVFPSDKLPKTIEKYPCGFVVNTYQGNEPGTHWLAFYFPSERKREFFDSFGHPLDFYSTGTFLKGYSHKFNNRKLQSN